MASTYPPTGKWLVPGNEEEGREQEVIHLGSRDSPGKESQPWPGLAFQSAQSLVLPSSSYPCRKQEVCTSNLTGASVLCCAHFLDTLNPGTGLSDDSRLAIRRAPGTLGRSVNCSCQTSRPLQPATSLSLPVNNYFFLLIRWTL